MSTTPLRHDIPEDPYARPRDWLPRRTPYKGPLRLVRLCVLGAFLPAALVAGPIYLRYRVYSEQLYPLAASDMRLIDRKVSTTWCQRQVVKVNTTFNAYLLKNAPKIEGKLVPISMTRHLVLEDDMKEYWGFYLLRGSSVTVSTCVRWPGASLTIIRGHKHLHECAFIGDDSSEELEELVQIAQERGLLNGTGADFHLRVSKDSGPSNVPEKMKRARQEVRFHEESNAPRHPNETLPSSGSESFNYGSHELDSNAMRQILTSLFSKTLDTKKKQKENVHHHYEGVFKDSANIDKPPVVQAPLMPPPGDPFWSSNDEGKKTVEKPSTPTTIHNPTSATSVAKNVKKVRLKTPTTRHVNGSEELKGSKGSESTKGSEGSKSWEVLNSSKGSKGTKDSSGFDSPQEPSESKTIKTPTNTVSSVKTASNIWQGTSKTTTTVKPSESSLVAPSTSGEVFEDVLKKLSSLGERGKQVLRRLVDEIDRQDTEAVQLKGMLTDIMANGNLSPRDKKRLKRQLVLGSQLHNSFVEDADSTEDAAIEKEDLYPDGIAEDRGTVNETTLNDRSNSEFWSSFSSSEERLLQCEGLILNLPLTPHRRCLPKFESEHTSASVPNTVTYRVPTDGYYFFVFNSENEIQPNFVRIRFDLMKNVYDTSDPVHACKNSTNECALPFNFFSQERTVLELPLSGNDSQWNEEYVVVSTCEPRTSVYLICIITVPLLILLFAFQ